MRINLVTPFAENDAVKALGARWDAAKNCWYIVDVKDLAPLARWIAVAKTSFWKTFMGLVWAFLVDNVRHRGEHAIKHGHY